MNRTHTSRPAPLLIAAAFAFIADRPASAGMIQHEVLFDGYSTFFEYPLFDPALGALVDVTYSIVGSVGGFSTHFLGAVPREEADPNFDFFGGSVRSWMTSRFATFNVTPFPGSPEGVYRTLVEFTPSPAPEASCQGAIGFDAFCTAYPQFDYDFDLIARYQPGSGHSWNLDLPATFASLTGVGTNTFLFGGQGFAQWFDLTNAQPAFGFNWNDVTISGVMTVSYFYDPEGNGLGPGDPGGGGGPGGGGPGGGGPGGNPDAVPEPGTLLLAGLGLAAMARSRRTFVRRESLPG